MSEGISATSFCSCLVIYPCASDVPRWATSQPVVGLPLVQGRTNVLPACHSGDDAMPYTVSAAKGAASVSVRCSSLREALNYARSLILRGKKVSIQDEKGNRIEGEDLEACCQGWKSLSDDLKAV